MDVGAMDESCRCGEEEEEELRCVATRDTQKRVRGLLWFSLASGSLWLAGGEMSCCVWLHRAGYVKACARRIGVWLLGGKGNMEDPVVENRCFGQDRPQGESGNHQIITQIAAWEGVCQLTENKGYMRSRAERSRSRNQRIKDKTYIHIDVGLYKR